MEALSDESCDSDIKTMKDQLNEYGLGDEYLSKEEMSDLLRALNDSKTTAKEDELLRHKVDDISESPPKHEMKRRYLSVKDRRLPWCLLPPDITPAQKVRTLAVYIKLMAINRYRQARQAIKFAAWPAPIQIMEESTRVQPLRSTRSGRMAPMYTDFDDDSTDLDFIVTKTKRRKISGTEVDLRAGGGMYSNKTFSLKRKSIHDDTEKLSKEIITNDFSIEASASVIKKLNARLLANEDDGSEVELEIFDVKN